MSFKECSSKNVLLRNNYPTSGITAKLLKEAFLLGLAEIGRAKRLFELEVVTPFITFS